MAHLINEYTAWHKYMRVIFCLPYTTHNYSMYNLDYNIMERFDSILVSLFIFFCIRIIPLFSQ